MRKHTHRKRKRPMGRASGATCMSPAVVASRVNRARELRAEGRLYHRPVKAGLWDTDFVSNNTTPSRHQWGYALQELAHLTRADVLHGVGLRKRPAHDLWAVYLPVTDEILGYAPPSEAMGYKIYADIRFNYTLEVYQ